MMVRVTGLDILLATVEYGLRRQQLRKNAANRPDVCKHALISAQLVAHVHARRTEIQMVPHNLTDGFGVVPSSQEQFRCSVPEGDHHRVEIG